MEALSVMIKRVENAGLLEGVYVGSQRQISVRITHLLFADDTLVFCGADRLQILHLRCLFLGFEAVSGLKVNLNKSELIPVGKVENIGNLAAVMDCKSGSLPSMYLGMPLGAKFKNKVVWEKVIEKSRKRLSEWQQQYLSKGAKVTLIKSVLFSLPSYLFSLFVAPQSVIKEMEKIQRDFLWGRNSNTFRYNLVAWKNVCSSMKSGGVGVKNLTLQNYALLGKWIWRYAVEDFSLWKRLIFVKYGEERCGWFTARNFKNYGVSLWKGIMKSWPHFSQCIVWQLGRGDRILFWKNRWLEIGVLAEVFPEIFDLAVNKQALVWDYHTVSGHNCVWNIELRRNVNDWELESFLKLLEILYSIDWPNSEDKLVWDASRNKVFNVNSFYSRLKGDVVDSFPWSKIWKSVAAPRVSFFVWCATRGSVLTIDNLQIRGHYMVNRCVLCLRGEETIDHLFIHCPWTSEIWSFILACFGVLSCPPIDLKSFLLSWWGQPMARKRREVWNLVPLCLFWTVWKERNRRTFDDKGSTTVKIKSLFFNCLFSWVNGGREADVESLMFFIESMSKGVR